MINKYGSLQNVPNESNGFFLHLQPGSVAQSVGHLTRKSEVLGLIPGLATYFLLSFCSVWPHTFVSPSAKSRGAVVQLLAKVCAQSTG